MPGPRQLILPFALVSLAVGAAGAAERSSDGAVRGIVVDEAQHPVAGATVILTRSRESPDVATSVTGTDGRFLFVQLPADSYSLLVLFGDARTVQRGIHVGADEKVDVRATLPLSPEVITIHEHAPPAKLATPIRSSTRGLPHYSDRAIETNTWAVGWVLLDIDARGLVTRFRFLHQPGSDLEESAAARVWKLRFEPARDRAGRAVPSQMLWKLEWPSYWWWQERVMIPTPGWTPRGPSGPLVPSTKAGPRLVARFPVHAKGAILPPCRGSGPSADVSMSGGRLSSSSGVYRDCSLPDFDAALTAPVIVRPATR